MKFVIERASSSKDIKPPCDGAFIVGDGYFGPIWGIEVNTLEELLKLADLEEFGVVVSKTRLDKVKAISDYEILIYDGYIE